jgi:hypothetical protein
MSSEPIRRVQATPYAQLAEYESEDRVERMTAAQTGEEERTAHPQTLDLFNEAGMTAELETDAEGADRLAFVARQKINPTEIEVVERVERFLAQGTLAEVEGSHQVPFQNGQAVA